MSTTEHYLLQKQVSLEEFSGELDKLWSQLREPDSDIRDRAIQAGISPSDLEEITKRKREDAISVKTEGMGIDPLTTALLIAAGTTIAKDLWDQVLLPLIKQKLGVNAIKKKE